MVLIAAEGPETDGQFDGVLAQTQHEEAKSIIGKGRRQWKVYQEF